MKTLANSKPVKRGKSRLGSLRNPTGDTGANSADWTSADGKLVIELISSVTALGGAVRFGYTRDGGAYSLGIYLDDDSETFYFPPSVDVDENLAIFVERLKAIADGGGA